MITTDVGGLKEMFEGRGTGIVVDEISGDAIKNAIENFFETDKKEKFKESIKREKERLSWSNFCNKLIDFAESI